MSDVQSYQEKIESYIIDLCEIWNCGEWKTYWRYEREKTNNDNNYRLEEIRTGFVDDLRDELFEISKSLQPTPICFIFEETLSQINLENVYYQLVKRL